MSLNSSTGVISGAPTTLGAFLIGLSVAQGTHSLSHHLRWDVVRTALNPVADRSSQEGDSISLALVGLSVNSPAAFEYSVSGLPAGLTLHPVSGLISGVLAAGAAGEYEVVAGVMDGSGGGVQTFAWSVAPRLSLDTPDDQQTVEGSSVSLAADVSYAGSLSLTYSATGLPDGLTINSSTGLIAGTLAAGSALEGPSWVTWSVTDGTYEGQAYFLWSPSPAAPPSTPTFAAVVPQVGRRGESVQWQMEAESPEGYALTFSATGLPQGLFLDPASGLISGELLDPSDAFYAVTITADDGFGTPGTQTLSYLVSGGPDWEVKGGFRQGAALNESVAGMLATLRLPEGLSISDFVVSVSPGDGGSAENATLEDLGGGWWAVRQEAEYEEQGSYTTTVNVSGPDGYSQTVQSTVVVGVVLVGETVSLDAMVFAVADASASASDYTATINWGDGTTSEGVVSGSDGVFTVSTASGQEHVYAQDSTGQSGGAFQVSVTLTGGGDTLVRTIGQMVSRHTITAHAGQILLDSREEFGDVIVAVVVNPVGYAPGHEASIEMCDGKLVSSLLNGSGGMYTISIAQNLISRAAVPAAVLVSVPWSNVLEPIIASVAAFVAPPVTPFRLIASAPKWQESGAYEWVVDFDLGTYQQTGFIVQQVMVRYEIRSGVRTTKTSGKYPDVSSNTQEYGKPVHTGVYYEIWEVDNGTLHLTTKRMRGNNLPGGIADIYALSPAATIKYSTSTIPYVQFGRFYFDPGRKVGGELVPTDGWAFWDKQQVSGGQAGDLATSEVRPTGLGEMLAWRGVYQNWNKVAFRGPVFTDRIAVYGNGEAPYISWIGTSFE